MSSDFENLPAMLARRSEAGDLDSGRRISGEGALRAAVRFWFSVTLIGQALFVVHIVGFYGRTLISGDFKVMNKALPLGYVPGDRIGNVMLGIHLMAAAVLSFVGVLQLLPLIRARAPVFHRWSGRLYVSMALMGALSALYLLMIRGHQPGTPLQHGITVLNAVLIIGFAVLALQYARARDFAAHRRWALRLFLVVSGVFFFRIEVFAWLFAVGPVGFDPDSFQGPVLNLFGFLQYALPLAILECYFRTQRSTGNAKFAMAGALSLLTVVMMIGIFTFAMYIVGEGTAV
jgi:uncharacterized membrane protein